MLNIKNIRDNFEKVARNLETRGVKRHSLLELKESDELRRKLLVNVEELKKNRNMVSNEIAQLKRTNKDAAGKISEMQHVGVKIKEIEDELAIVDKKYSYLLAILPNLPNKDVPIGEDEKANVEVRREGVIPKFSFVAQAHWDLGEKLGILDFKRGAKVTGSRFLFYKGLGAKLERALYNFMLDEHGKEGYKEMIPPYMVNEESMFGTGNFPKFKEDVFQLEDQPYIMIPTAEVPLTNYYRGEILAEEDLPIYFTALTPSFRSEAGSAGRDTRGLIRLHQFNKVEMVKFSVPENSYNELDKMLANAENILQKLGLAYRVVVLSTGDMGFSAAKTYDLEVWIPTQNMYREISSCSNTEDFQARRARIRYQDKFGKIHHVHTLNGSGLAVGRTVTAILENYQNEDGSITIPEVLCPYMGGISKIEVPK